MQLRSTFNDAQRCLPRLFFGAKASSSTLSARRVRPMFLRRVYKRPMLSSGWWITRKAGAVLCGFLLLSATSSTMAQTPEPTLPAQQYSISLLSPSQLDNLTAPIALYPDPLLGQVLAASTYPLEIAEEQQWLQQNRTLQGARLLEAARQQNWDPSVQALVAFPDVLMLLNRDLRWTTDVGNAFLAQQADLMNAVQRMRAQAQDNGRLSSTPQQTVTVAEQDGQSAIEIQPANPQVIYVPTYNPTYVWGTPGSGAYPALGYPDTDSGSGFNPGVIISALFSGLSGFGGWGWVLNWITHALFLNNLFLGHFGFGSSGGNFGGSTVWVHNPSHRLGVTYPNPVVASRFAIGRSNAGFSSARSYNAGSFSNRSYNANPYRDASAGARANAPHEQGYGGSGFNGDRRALSNSGMGGRSFDAERSSGQHTYQSYNRSGKGMRSGESASRYNSPMQSYRAASNSAPQRGSQTFASSYRSASPSAKAPAPSVRYSAPKTASHSSAPHFSNASRSSHASAHSSSHSGGHTSSHSSGKHSGKHK